MARRKPKVPAKSGYTDTRFNATKYGILSRHTVLPWEDAEEYRELHDALIAEYAPHGPTEGHLVEELAGIMWRKQRLRMAEAGAARDFLGQLATEHSKSQSSWSMDLDIFNGDKTETIDEEALSLIAIPPREANAELNKIEGQLKKGYTVDQEDLERQRDHLKRYREMHEAAQSYVAAGPSFEKLARYETHLDRKFERTLTMLLRMQEFRNRSAMVGTN
jgi:hypothetical protein